MRLMSKRRFAVPSGRNRENCCYGPQTPLATVPSTAQVEVGQFWLAGVGQFWLAPKRPLSTDQGARHHLDNLRDGWHIAEIATVLKVKWSEEKFQTNEFYA